MTRCLSFETPQIFISCLQFVLSLLNILFISLFSFYGLTLLFQSFFSFVFYHTLTRLYCRIFFKKKKKRSVMVILHHYLLKDYSLKIDSVGLIKGKVKNCCFTAIFMAKCIKHWCLSKKISHVYRMSVIGTSLPWLA